MRQNRFARWQFSDIMQPQYELPQLVAPTARRECQSKQPLKFGVDQTDPLQALIGMRAERRGSVEHVVNTRR
jgi:hypothetical protein